MCSKFTVVFVNYLQTYYVHTDSVTLLIFYVLVLNVYWYSSFHRPIMKIVASLIMYIYDIKKIILTNKVQLCARIPSITSSDRSQNTYICKRANLQQIEASPNRAQIMENFIFILCIYWLARGFIKIDVHCDWIWGGIFQDFFY
jgi:hypothetical protein